MTNVAAELREAVGPLPWHRRGLHNGSRFLHVGVGLVYLLFFMQIYQSYISYIWGYAGFLYRPLDDWEMAFVTGGVGIVSFAMPQQILRPSSVIIWLMYAFVYVPTMAMTFMLGEYPPATYLAPLGAFTAMMVVMSVVSQLGISEHSGVEAMPSDAFAAVMLALLIVFTAIQYNVYADVISFASVDDVYYQRFAASEVGGGAIGYVRTHYYYAIAPALVAFGLCSSRMRVLLPIGVAGFVFTYMIDASKVALLVPVAMVALYFIATRTSASVNLFTGGLTALTFGCSLLTSQVSFARFLADLVIVRSISVPAQTFHQYYDLFSDRGYTWWSNINGIRLFVPPPAGFANDAQWPVLGLIIGREYYGSTLMNANANPFSGEGVAAAGAFGVIVIGLFVTAWLRTFDLAARGWNRVYVLLIAAPLGLCLTNAHLSTMLLSFGGAFWIVLLALYKPAHRLGIFARLQGPAT